MSGTSSLETRAVAASSDASQYDVIVVGGGGSGLAAAAAAAEAGSRTLLLEKQPHLGGTTRLAVGSISAAGTRLQRAAGIHDDSAAFHEDMDAFTADLLPRDNPALRAVLAREAGPMVDWLETLGVAFAGPYPEPPHRVSRMHNTVPGPRLIVERLERAARQHGAVLLTNASVEALVRDGNGRVTGVTYRHPGGSGQALARGGVVLASGDFSGDDEMRERYLPVAAARAVPINRHNTGDGFRMASSVGAACRNMDAIFGPQLRFPRAARRGINDWLPTWPWLARLSALFFMRAPAWMLKPLVTSLMIANMSPSEQLFQQGALLLDARGRPLDAKRPNIAVAQTQERTGYIVMRAAVASAFQQAPFFISTAPGIAYAYLGDYERGRPDLVHRADDPAALARQLGMDPAQVTAAFDDEGGPLVALGPVHAMLTTTEGAAAVDTQCRVLDGDGAPIEGLYAAGCMGQGGMMLRGHGLHLAWAFTSGRKAGREAAAQATRLQARDGRGARA